MRVIFVYFSARSGPAGQLLAQYPTKIGEESKYGCLRAKTGKISPKNTVNWPYLGYFDHILLISSENDRFFQF